MKHFYSQILIVLFFTHRRMKSVQMEKAMCVLTLVVIKFVQKPTNWSYICWHTQERDLTRYIVWATDSMEQSHSIRSQSLCLFFQKIYLVSLLSVYSPFLHMMIMTKLCGKCLPLWLTSFTHIWGLLWGQLRLMTLIIFVCLFIVLLLIRSNLLRGIGTCTIKSIVSIWYCVIFLCNTTQSSYYM